MEDDYDFEDFDYEPEQILIEKTEENKEQVVAHKNNLNNNQVPSKENKINNNYSMDRRIEKPIEDQTITYNKRRDQNQNENYALNYNSNSNNQNPKVTEKKVTPEEEYGYEEFENPEENNYDDIEEIKEIDDIVDVIATEKNENKNYNSKNNNLSEKQFSADNSNSKSKISNNIHSKNNENNFSKSNIASSNHKVNPEKNQDNSFSSIFPTKGNDISIINNLNNVNNHPKTNSNLVPLSKLQIAEKNYFELKEQLEHLMNNKEQSLNQGSHKSKTVDVLSKQNLDMIKFLDKMNGIINTIIESSKVPNKNPNFSRKILINPNHKSLTPSNPSVSSSSNSTNKLLEVFRKEHVKLEQRLKQITDPTFDQTLEDSLSDVNSQINYYEAEVKKLKYQQKQSEILVDRQFKNNNSFNNNADFQKINQEYENTKRLNEMTLEKVQKNKSQISDNETRLNELNEWLGKLETIAKDLYGIKTFENINFKEEEKSEKKKEEKKTLLKKKLDTFEKVQSTNKRRYENEISRHEKSIVNLEKNKIELMKLLKEKSIISYKTQEKVKGIYNKYEENINNCMLLPTSEDGNLHLIMNKIVSLTSNGINYNNSSNPAENISSLNELKDMDAVQEINGRGNNATLNNSNLNDISNIKHTGVTIDNKVEDSFNKANMAKKDIIMQLENRNNSEKYKETEKELISTQVIKESSKIDNNINNTNPLPITSSVSSNAPQINSRHFKPNIKFGNNNVITNPNSNQLNANSNVVVSSTENTKIYNENNTSIPKKNNLNKNDEIVEDIITGQYNNDDIKEILENNVKYEINNDMNTNTNSNKNNIDSNSRLKNNNEMVNNVTKNEIQIHLDEETPLNISRRRNNRENKENLNSSIVGNHIGHIGNQINANNNSNLNRSILASSQINNINVSQIKNDTSILKEKSNVPLFLQDFHKKNEDGNTSLINQNLNVSENKIIPASRRLSQATSIMPNANQNTNNQPLFNNGGSSTFNERKPVSIFDDPFKDDIINKKYNNENKFILEDNFNTYDRKKKEEFDNLFKDDEDIKDIKDIPLRVPGGNLLFSNKNNNVSTTGRNRENIGNGNVGNAQNGNINIFSLNEGIDNLNRKTDNISTQNKNVKPRNILDELEEIVL